MGKYANIQVKQFIVRWYENEDGFDNYDPYYAVCTLDVLDRDAVFISAMHGNICRKSLRSLVNALGNMGYTKIAAIRHGEIHYYDISKYLEK